MIKNLYDWTLRMTGHKMSVPFLCIVSFCESIFFPIPPDVMLIPMILVKRSRAWIYAALTTAFSSLGGIIGYIIGSFFYEIIGSFIIPENGLNQFNEYFIEYGLLIILASGFLPIIPFKVFTVASGFFGIPIPIFIFGTVISRGLRYFLIAYLLWKFGITVKKFIETNLNLLAILFIIIVVIIFIMLRLF